MSAGLPVDAAAAKKASAGTEKKLRGRIRSLSD